MAPAAKNTKSGSGKDIRTFFGSTPNSQKTQPTSSLDYKKKEVHRPSKVAAESIKEEDAIMIIDSDDEPVSSKKQHVARVNSKNAVAGSSKQMPQTSLPAKVVSSEDEMPKPSAVKRRKAAALLSSDDEDEMPKPSAVKRKKAAALLSSDDEDEEPKKASPPKKKAAVANGSSSNPKPKPRTSASAKTRMNEDKDFEMASNEDAELVSAKSSAKMPAKKPGKKNKGDADPESKGKGKVKEEEPKKEKFNWAAAKAAKLAGPPAHGSKAVPDGEDNCLFGLSFVFTGELSSFSRDEAIDIAKRFGGRVVGQPSTKTDYVVLGDNAGPSKLNAIKKHGLKTLDEDQFLNLIATRKGNGKGLDQKTKKKLEKEQEAIKAAAKEMEKREKEAAKTASSNTSQSTSKVIDPSTQLWTTRYAPQSLKEICGNKSQVEKLETWLKEWPQSYKAGFKKPGKNGMNMYRAVLISGSPGIGKTTSAHLCATLAGYTPIELNASDTRSKKLVENGMNVNNTSLDNFIHGSSSTNSSGITITDRTCLIMDEVDGMSAGDRGGVGALNALIKKSKIPIICIANDRGAQKLKPLMSTTFSLTFSKPQAAQIRSRILSIAFKEKMKIPANVIDQLIAGSQSDIRQVLNMLSTWKLSSNTMSFDEGKELTKMNEKYSVMSPFDITSKVLGPYLFSHTSRETLGDKMDYYFQDHSFVPLFIQENYLKTQPAKVRSEEGPDKTLKQLQLMDRAASSISDGDLVDVLIHGPEQHWSLMPLHAVCSTVRPASFVYGAGAHYGGPNGMSFPQWLGQNSKQNKLTRQLGDVQTRMRLKVSGNKTEIRQSYIPALHPRIVQPLADDGASAVDDIIETMDEYYLSREDWDTIVELGVDTKKDDIVLKKIPPSVKTAFTRKYNSTDHPIPFHKAQDLGKVPKKLAAEPLPDLEEAYDFDEVVDDVSDEEEKDPDDISKDKLIQASKKKKAPAKK